jgi:hypothetical protein
MNREQNKIFVVLFGHQILMLNLIIRRSQYIMQTIKYTSGIWDIEAKIQDIGDNNRLAIVSAIAGEGEMKTESKHTIVFEHISGCDEVDEAKVLASQVITRAH